MLVKWTIRSKISTSEVGVNLKKKRTGWCTVPECSGPVCVWIAQTMKAVDICVQLGQKVSICQNLQLQVTCERVTGWYTLQRIIETDKTCPLPSSSSIKRMMYEYTTGQWERRKDKEDIQMEQRMSEAAFVDVQKITVKWVVLRMLWLPQPEVKPAGLTALRIDGRWASHNGTRETMVEHLCTVHVDRMAPKRALRLTSSACGSIPRVSGTSLWILGRSRWCPRPRPLPPPPPYGPHILHSLHYMS